MEKGNIVRLFLQAADQYPDRVLFTDGVKEITYGRFLSEVKKTAFQYRQKGIRKGDKLFVFVPMSPDLYRVLLALFYLGACPVFLDAWVSRKRLAACCNVVPPKGLIATGKLLWVSWLIPELRKLPLRLSSGGTGREELGAEEEMNGEETALVTFTTGSTGIPKAADRTHGFLQAQYSALMPLLENEHRISLTLLPIVVLLNIGLGKTTVLPHRSVKATKQRSVRYLSGLIRKTEPQTLIGSPALVYELSRQFLKEGGSGLRQVITGGGPVFPDMANTISAAFPDAGKVVVYGSTEAEPVSSIALEELAEVPNETVERHGLPVGYPDPAARVAIIPYLEGAAGDRDEEAWARLKLPPGSAGEIVVSGGHVLKAYIGNKEAVRQHKINVGGTVWHRTGDAGRMDENGRLYFLGRASERLEWLGKEWYPLVTTYLLGRKVGIGGAALLLHKHQPVLVVEKKDKPLEARLSAALEEMGLQGALIRFRRLPRDPRHQTKIDYEKLRNILSSSFV